MGIVGGSHKRGESWTIILGTAIDGASIHFALRERLLQGRLLTGTDRLQLVEVHQQIVRQRHLLVELIRQVQMIEEIQAQVRRKQTLHEGRLTTTLRTNQRGHTLVAVKRVHLKPVGHSRAQPDGEVVHLLRAEAWQTTEELG